VCLLLTAHYSSISVSIHASYTAVVFISDVHVRCWRSRDRPHPVPHCCDHVSFLFTSLQLPAMRNLSELCVGPLCTRLIVSLLYQIQQAASLAGRDNRFAHYFELFWGLGLLLGYIARLLLTSHSCLATTIYYKPYGHYASRRRSGKNSRCVAIISL